MAWSPDSPIEIRRIATGLWARSAMQKLGLSARGMDIKFHGSAHGAELAAEGNLPHQWLAYSNSETAVTWGSRGPFNSDLVAAVDALIPGHSSILKMNVWQSAIFAPSSAFAMSLFVDGLPAASAAAVKKALFEQQSADENSRAQHWANLISCSTFDDAMTFVVLELRRSVAAPVNSSPQFFVRVLASLRSTAHYDGPAMTALQELERFLPTLWHEAQANRPQKQHRSKRGLSRHSFWELDIHQLALQRMLIDGWPSLRLERHPRRDYLPHQALLRAWPLPAREIGSEKVARNTWRLLPEHIRRIATRFWAYSVLEALGAELSQPRHLVLITVNDQARQTITACFPQFLEFLSGNQSLNWHLESSNDFTGLRAIKQFAGDAERFLRWDLWALLAAPPGWGVSHKVVLSRFSQRVWPTIETYLLSQENGADEAQLRPILLELCECPQAHAWPAICYVAHDAVYRFDFNVLAAVLEDVWTWRHQQPNTSTPFSFVDWSVKLQLSAVLKRESERILKLRAWAANLDVMALFGPSENDPS